MTEIIISILLGLIIGVVTGFFIRVKMHEKSLENSRLESKKIVEDGQKEAEKIKKELILEARQDIFNQKKELERDIKERKQVVIDLETKIMNRDEMLNRRASNLDKREEHLGLKEIKLDEKKVELEQLNSKVEDILKKQEEKLIEISGISTEQAQDIIMDRVRNEMSEEISAYIKEAEEKAKAESDQKAKGLLTLAIQKYASETTSERTVSVVTLPTDEMKGRIIGREGRNIRTIEALTGVDLIIDDTP
ncbi:MAG TPA: ribonuclease Y, partial [Acholeplasmataceae bacterium]|nr:ribonuclease Y [Acholeplasmataceae bacterium]